MYHPNPNDPYNPEKLIYIWLIISGLVLLTSGIVGVQVYWWQKSVATVERKQLLTKINKLQNEIRFLQQRAELQNAPVNPQDQDYQKQLAGKEQKVIMALKQNDLNALVSYIHPLKGVRFSPYAYINLKSDLIFPANRMKFFFLEKAARVWGYYEDTGTPIKLTNEAYYKAYVYDVNYALADKISYNHEISGSLTAENVFEVYPKAIVAEYQSSETGNQGEATVWRNLKLVFEREGKTWYLVSIIHDRWTI